MGDIESKDGRRNVPSPSWAASRIESRLQDSIQVTAESGDPEAKIGASSSSSSSAAAAHQPELLPAGRRAKKPISATLPVRYNCSTLLFKVEF